MYADISTTSPASIFLVQTIDRQHVPSQYRVKAVAMGLGLALAKNLPHMAATSANDINETYGQTYEPEVRDFVGALNELSPIDVRLTQVYAFKFYQLLHSVPFQPAGFFEAATAISVAHMLLGTELYFSQEDIVFMDQYKDAVVRIAASTGPVIAIKR